MSKLSLWLAVLFLSANTLICAGATPGAVDPTFDAGRGTEYVTPSSGNSVLVQPDGKILVAGVFNALNLDFAPAVLRLNPDGTLDGSFHVSLLPEELYGYEYAPKLLALQPNGQVLVGGTFANPDGSTRYLTRLNGDGSVDITFNPRFESVSGPSTILQAKVLSGGRILIGGYFNSINGVTRNSLARLNADGSLDETFNAAVLSKRVVVVQSTGKPIVATGGNFTYGGDRLHRLNTDGSLDGTFATVIPPSGYIAGGLVVQPDDKLIWTAIWAGGYADWPPTIINRSTADGANDPDYQPYSSYGGAPQFLQQDGRLIIFSAYSGAKRLNSDGSPDSSFHPIALGYFAQQADGRLVVTSGTIYTQPYGIRRLFLDGSSDDSFDPGMGLISVRKVAIRQARLLPNRKIVIAGNFNYIDRVPRTSIAVLNANGSVDPAFDTGTLIGAPGGSSSFNAMAVQADGKILVSFGYSLVRLGPDGGVDQSFHYNSSPYTVWELGTQPSGKILLTNDAGQLKRLNLDGSVDPTFSPSQPGSLVAVQPDAKIVLRANSRLIRLMVDGALDDGFNSPPGTGNFPPTFLTLQPNGMFLVARFLDGIDSFYFSRFNQNGGLDEAFSPEIRRVSLAAADLTGIYFWGNVLPLGQPVQLEIGRFFFDGSRDPNFAVQFNSGAELSTLLVQPNGQLLVAGLFDHVNGVERAGIARLNGAAPKKLANLSTRVGVGTGQRVEIGGFIIAGNMPKKVIVRALGPSLGSGGVLGSETLANPSLELHDSTGALIGQNDDWRDTQEAEIMATGIPPLDNAEAAIVKVLAPGQYTAVIQGHDSGEGIGLAEVYDLDPFSNSSLANISTRGFVNNNDGAMIAGLILRGAETSTIVARAMGPSLLASGVADALADPTLELHDADGALIEANDNWKENEAAIGATGLSPGNDLESALVRTLPPGAYTAIVRGKNNTTGVGLVEIYNLP